VCTQVAIELDEVDDIDSSDRLLPSSQR